MRRLPYPLLCALLGLALGWLPGIVHGPIRQKFDVLYIDGGVAVWAWYCARLLIGGLVGITWWPARWYLRGPLCGAIMMTPIGFISLAVPSCGPWCMFWNVVTAMVVGVLVAGVARGLTGRDHG